MGRLWTRTKTVGHTDRRRNRRQYCAPEVLGKREGCRHPVESHANGFARGKDKRLSIVAGVDPGIVEGRCAGEPGRPDGHEGSRLGDDMHDRFHVMLSEISPDRDIDGRSCPISADSLGRIDAGRRGGHGLNDGLGASEGIGMDGDPGGVGDSGRSEIGMTTNSTRKIDRAKAGRGGHGRRRGEERDKNGHEGRTTGRFHRNLLKKSDR